MTGPHIVFFMKGPHIVFPLGGGGRFSQAGLEQILGLNVEMGWGGGSKFESILSRFTLKRLSSLSTEV